VESEGSARKREILNAIVEYIVEHGVSNLSLRTVAAAAGTKARLLIYHFGSKEKMVAEAMSALRDRVKEGFAKGPGARAETPGAILRAFWKRTVEKRNAKMMRVFFEVHALALTQKGPYSDYMRESFAVWGRMIEAAIPPHVPPARRQAIACLVVDAFDGLILDYLSTGDLRRTERALDIFATEIDRMARRRTK
jgi:AcrR family transcriptional regulator